MLVKNQIAKKTEAFSIVIISFFGFLRIAFSVKGGILVLNE